MGNICNNNLEQDEVEFDYGGVTEYNLNDDDKSNIDLSYYESKDLLNEVIIKTDLNGKSYTINNCKDSHIYLFDHCSQVFIDDCINCSIIIGPCNSSVFIRNCKQSNFLL